jgi:hypothetical protein
MALFGLRVLCRVRDTMELREDSARIFMIMNNLLDRCYWWWYKGYMEGSEELHHDRR